MAFLVDRHFAYSIRFKSIWADVIDSDIKFELSIILQSRYLKLVTIQHAGISFKRNIFNLLTLTNLTISEKE